LVRRNFENVAPAGLKPLPQIGKRALYFRAKALDETSCRFLSSKAERKAESQRKGDNDSCEECLAESRRDAEL